MLILKKYLQTAYFCGIMLIVNFYVYTSAVIFALFVFLNILKEVIIWQEFYVLWAK